MGYELTVNSEFKAIHSLAEREEPHEHLWRIQASVTATLENGRVLSLPLFKNLVDELLHPLRGRLLNEHSGLDSETQSQPTCENLSRFIYQGLAKALFSINAERSSPIQLLWVAVAVVEPDGFELGSVRYQP